MCVFANPSCYIPQPLKLGVKISAEIPRTCPEPRKPLHSWLTRQTEAAFENIVAVAFISASSFKTLKSRLVTSIFRRKSLTNRYLFYKHRKIVQKENKWPEGLPRDWGKSCWTSPPLESLLPLWSFDATINIANANGLMPRLQGLLPG